MEKIGPNDLAKLKELIQEMDNAGSDKDYALMGRLNIEFHRTIYTASGNMTLINMINGLWEKTYFARLVFKFKPFRAKNSNKEHKMIVEALENKNSKRAEKLIILQSEKTLQLLNLHLEKKKN